MRNRVLILIICLVLTFMISSSVMGAVLGDLNDDGSVNSNDYTLFRRYLLNMSSDINLGAAKLSDDNDINSTDYILMRRYILGIINSFPGETEEETGEDAWKSNTGTINLDSLTYSGDGIFVSGSIINIVSGGDHTVTGTLSNGMISIDTDEKVKLRLKNANISNSDGPAIYGLDVDKLFITLVEGTINNLSDGDYYIDDKAKAALFCEDDLEINGTGTLNVTGNYKHAICSDDDLVIENGVINVISAESDGLHANDSLIVKGGKFDITVSKDGIENENEELIIEGGEIKLSTGKQAIESETAVTINGGTINVVDCFEGIEAPLITINDGYIYIKAEDDALNATTGTGSWHDDGSHLIINGGNIYLNSVIGDPLDSNGSLTITGGIVVAHGPQAQPEVGVDVNGLFTVSGGTVLVTGTDSFMSQYPEGQSSQYSIAAMFNQAIAANSPFCIKDSSGRTLVIFKAERRAHSVIFSSPELEYGSTYTIYTGGSVSGGTETHGLITGGTYNGGRVLDTITIDTSPTTTSNWSSWGWGWW